MIEDMDFADLGVVVLERRSTDGRAAKWVTHSILKGVDRMSEAYRQIMQNLQAIVGEDCEQALMDEAAEYLRALGQAAADFADGVLV
ncbi:MAG: hypothetical protein ACYDD1_04915 [Caulobacteraceae bacterium]